MLEEIFLEQYLKDIKLSEKNKFIKTKKIYGLVNSKKMISTKYIDTCVVNTSISKKIKINKQLKSLTENIKEKSKDMRINILEHLDTGNCSFKLIEFIVNNKDSEIYTMDQIKQVLIDFYTNANYPNELIPYGRGSDDNNWSFFSLVQWYSFQTINTEKIHKQPMNKKNELIANIIMHTNYMPTELDLLIILNHYNISSIVVSTNKGFVMCPTLQKINLGSIEDRNKYIIVTKVNKSEKVPKRRMSSSISLGIVKLDNNVIIDVDLLKNIGPPIPLDNFIKAFIDNRFTLQNKTKIKKISCKKIRKEEIRK